MADNEQDTLSLLSNFTHQIINPLNGIVGTIDNILDGTVPKDRVEVRLSSIRGQLHGVISLVRNLAFFAEYTSSYSSMRPGKASKLCVIPQLLIEAATFYQEPAHKRDISIEVEDRSMQHAVRGNGDLLRQVFMNIFDNALKYGDSHGRVIAKYWIQPKKKAGVNTMIISISGPSSGFSRSEDIFGLGVRGREAESITASGSGLGLHICKLIVENVFRGSVTAQHVRKTRLTTIEIRLPGAIEDARSHE